MRRLPESVAPLAILASVALLYCGSGFLPGRVLVPMDLLADTGAWKPDPTVRVPVSNRLLSDAVLQFVPWDDQIRRSVKAGRFPWNNPFAGNGDALFANPQTAVLSPFTWPRLWLGLRGWALCVLLKLLVAGFGAYRLTRQLGASAKASVVSGIVYMTSGFSIVWGLHMNTNVFACLPWLGAAGLGVLCGVTAARVGEVILWAALATAGGHPETLAFGVIAIAAFLAWEVRSSRGPAGRVKRNSAILVAAALAGFLLLGVELVPFLRLLPGSQIASNRQEGTASGIRIFAIAGQVLPGFLGSPLEKEIDLSGAVPGSENFNMRSESFVGLIVLLLIILARRKLAGPLRRGLIIALAALLISWRLPPVGLLWKHIPLLSLFAPEYASVAFVFFASLAAGPAWETIVESPERWRRTGIVLILAALALTVVGLTPSVPASRSLLLRGAQSIVDSLRARGHFRQPPEVYAARMDRYLAAGQTTALRRFAIPGLLLGLCGFGLTARKRRAPILGVALAAELIAFGVGYLPSISAGQIPATPAPIADLKRLPGYRSWMIASAADLYPPNLATLDEVHDVASYDVLSPRSWARRLAKCGFNGSTQMFGETLTPDDARCLAAEGVRYFLAREPPAGLRRAGGGLPPAVGLYELVGARTANLPFQDEAPAPGFKAGLAVSGVGLALTAFLLWKLRARAAAPA